MSDINPFVKWAGGKSQIISEIKRRLPKSFNGYYEPFIGGGAVLFSLQPTNANINDINKQLINTYKQLKENSKKVINVIKELDKEECTKELYYIFRDKYNIKIQNDIYDEETAALFIWINKHCFNGLYRVNSKGLFNVPYNNRKNGSSMVESNLINIGNYLKNVNISNQDFELFCKDIKKGDFVYFDSPYIPESTTADFTSYTKEGFSLEDHKRLAFLFKQLDKIGANIMLSNNDVDLIYELYKSYKISSFNVKRMINSNASKRTGKEVIITNYEYSLEN